MIRRTRLRSERNLSGDAFARLERGDRTKLITAICEPPHRSIRPNARILSAGRLGRLEGVGRHQRRGNRLPHHRAEVAADGNDYVDGSCCICCSLSLDGRAIP